MAKLATCAACAGFLPASSSCCPHCDAPVPGPSRAARVAGRLVQVVTGGALAMTLMACYGGAPVECDADADADGSCAPADCNDDDASIYPGATEVPGDGIDQDCDGQDTPGGTGGGGAGGNGSGGAGGNGSGGAGGNGSGGAGGNGSGGAGGNGSGGAGGNGSGGSGGA